MQRLTPILVTVTVLLGSAGESLALPKCPGSYNTNTWINCEGTTILPEGVTPHNAGDKYIGEWENGKPHGQGTVLRIKNGDFKYVGGWKNGKSHGQGTYTKSNRKVLEGIWENGEFKYAQKTTPTSKPKPAKQVAQTRVGSPDSLHANIETLKAVNSCPWCFLEGVNLEGADHLAMLCYLP